MIYIHTFYTGKFNSIKNVRAYEDEKLAFAQIKVLGGSLKLCRVVHEFYM